MKKFILSLSVYLIFAHASTCCTTFFINKNGQLVFGRNYDWITGSGMVCTNQKGLAKTSMNVTGGKTISWVSQYGSISFNQYGKEFPTGGMNETGLVVELMWLDGTSYPEPDERPAIGVLQWIQYQLDNCSSVDELIATNKKLRIGSKGNPPLHYLVGDAAGNVATIEFLDGALLVHRGKELPFPVLTNDSYEKSVQQLGQLNGATDTLNFFRGNNSMERFAKTCSMVKQFQLTDTNMPVIDYSFDILNKVSQHSYTQWSIVYDISNKKIYFKTLEFPQIKMLAFTSFDLRCPSRSKAFDMNQVASNDVSGLFEPFSTALNSRIVAKSCEQSRSHVNISQKEQQALLDYAESIICQAASPAKKP